MKRSSPSSSDKSGINKGEAEVNKDVGGKHSPEKTGIQGGAHQPLAADVSGPLCAAPASDSSVIDVIASQDTDDVPATMPRMEPSASYLDLRLGVVCVTRPLPRPPLLQLSFQKWAKT